MGGGLLGSVVQVGGASPLVSMVHMGGIRGTQARFNKMFVLVLIR